MSQISADPLLDAVLARRPKPAAPTSQADPLMDAVLSRRPQPAIDPQQALIRNDPLGQGMPREAYRQAPVPTRSVGGEFLAAAESGIGRLTGMTGMRPMPDQFAPSYAPEGSSGLRNFAQGTARMAGEMAPAVVAGVASGGLAAPLVSGIGALGPAAGIGANAATAIAQGTAFGAPMGAMQGEATYQRTGNLGAAAASGLLNTAAGSIPGFSAAGRLPVNVAADALIQGGANVGTAYADEQIARAAGAAPMEVDPLAAFGAGATMTAGTRGIPAASRAIGDQVAMRQGLTPQMAPIDPGLEVAQAYRRGTEQGPTTNPLVPQRLTADERIAAYQPPPPPPTGDIPLADASTPAVPFAPAPPDMQGAIPLIDPTVPGPETMTLGALREEARRLGVLDTGPRTRSALGERVRLARAGIAVESPSPIPQGGNDRPPLDLASSATPVGGDPVPFAQGETRLGRIAQQPLESGQPNNRIGNELGNAGDPAHTPIVLGDTATPQVAARTPTERAPNGQGQEKGRQEGLLSPPRAETVTGAGEQPAPVVEPSRPTSWILTRKDNGEMIGEFFDRRSVDRFNPEKVQIETAFQYLARINREIQGKPPAQPPEVRPPVPEVPNVPNRAGTEPQQGLTQNATPDVASPKTAISSPDVPQVFTTDANVGRSEPNVQTVTPLPRERPTADMTTADLRQTARELGVFNGPRSREALAERIEAARAEQRRGRTTGAEIGVKTTEIDRFRKETGLSELSEPDRRRWETVLERAKSEGHVANADTTAAEVLKTGRFVSDVEHAGLVTRAAELANDYDAAIADANRLIDARDDGGARVARERANSIMEQIDTLTRAGDQAGRETARALSIRGMMVNRESFKLADVVQRAQTVKGSKLDPRQQAKLEAVTKAHAEAEARVKDLTAKIRETEAAKSKAEAKRVIEAEARKRETGALREQLTEAKGQRDTAAREAKTSERAADRLASKLTAAEKAAAEAKGSRQHTRAARVTEARQRLQRERADILAKIRELGYRANAGFDPEGLYHLGRLAVNVIQDGALTLEQVIAKVREHVPDATDQDVRDALIARNPKTQAKARTAAERQVAELKTQARLMGKIDRLAAGVLDAPKAKTQPSGAVRALRKELATLQAHAYKATTDAQKLDRSVRLINEIQDHLDNGTRPAKANKPQPTEELKQARQKIGQLKSLMRATDRIVELRWQLQSGEFVVPPEVAPRQVPRELEQAQIDLRKARSAVRVAIEAQRPWTTRRAVGEGLNTLRAIKATADVSATLRQGLVLASSRPATAARSFGKAMRAMLDSNTEIEIDEAIRSRPTHFLGEKAGLYLSDVQGSPNAREEAFMSNLIRKVPVLKQVAAASERHMTTYLNLMRTAAFDQFAAANPNATAAELKAWAAFVNVASGRGDLGRAAAISTELSTVIFSPRFAVSRFQTPWHLVKAGQSPRVRKAIARDIGATLALGGTALTLAAAAGLSVGDDPRESDFGKIRVGSTTVDVWGGLLQPARLILGMGVSATDRAGITNPGKLGPTSPLELISRFAMTKLSPGVTVPLEVGFGVNVIGQETDRLESAAKAFLPLILPDIYEAYQQGGAPEAIGVGVGSGLGLGMNTMTPEQIKKMERRKKQREAAQ